MDKLEMLDEIREMMKCINEVDSNLGIEQIPANVLLLMGETKAGKTTLMYYLLRKKLLLEQNQLGTPIMKAEVMYHNYLIGNSYQSTTIYPNIPPELDDHCLLIDMPGFSDTRPLYRLLNIYIILETIKKIKNVHVSFVLPFESLEGESLMLALQNSCKLLNPQFLKKDQCSSFILTKIEDRQADRSTFDDQMGGLREQYSQDIVGSILNHYEKMNTYLFCCQSPDVEEGGLLKQQIIKQNKFYPLNEHVQNLLSPHFADAIIGKGNLQEFNSYAIEMIQEMQRYFPTLYQLLIALIEFHHHELLFECQPDGEIDAESIRERIISCGKGLKIGGISQIDPLLEYRVDRTKEQQIQSLVEKVKLNINTAQNLQFLQCFDIIVDLSEMMTKQNSGINIQFRNAVHTAIFNSLAILKTIREVKNTNIQNQLKRFCNSQQLVELSKSIRSILDSTLIKSLAILPEAQQLMASNSEFATFILQVAPDALSSSRQRIRIIKQRCHDKIKNKKWQHQFLDTTKTLADKNIPKTKEKSLQIKNLIPQRKSDIKNFQKACNQLQSNQKTLELVLKSVKYYESYKKQLQSEEMLFKRQLWIKGVYILSDLRLIEEAILMSLAMPDPIHAAKLIDQGIQFRQLSAEYLQLILIPYYSRVDFNFSIVQKLFGYMSSCSQGFRHIFQVEKQYIKTLQSMRNEIQEVRGESEYQLKRFNIELIKYFVDGQGRKNLIERAKNNIKELSSSNLCSKIVRKQLSSLKMTDDA